MKIGIDCGLSSTKVVTIEGSSARNMEIWEGQFRQEHLEAYIQKYITRANNLEYIALTGVGCHSIGDIKGHRKKYVDEFDANATAASYVCQSDRYIVVSIGTATSFVMVNGNKHSHIGGSALGGGTLMSLFQMVMNGGGWQHLRMLADRGIMRNIDLSLSDVCSAEVPDLTKDATVVNLGKYNLSTRPEDIILGLENMILQNIGVMANLAGSGHNIREFVLFGRMVTLPHAAEIFEKVEKLYGIKFIIPQHPDFMTAIGAALH